MTSPMILPVRSARPSCLGRGSGFSLAEVMTQLTMLIVVTIPMVMALNLQKASIDGNRESTVSNSVISQLFDNVLVQHPDAIGQYTVDNANRASVYCDPATKVKDNIQFTATCTGGGADQNRPPFFERDLSYGSNNKTLRVEVRLYPDMGTPTGNPSSQITQEYDLDSYRIFAGNEVLDTDPNPRQAVEALVRNDSLGNIWLPLYSAPMTTSGNPVNNLTYYFNRDVGCTTTHPALDGMEVPFNGSHVYDSAGCAGGTLYIFKVAPNREYDLNLYFRLRGPIDMTCFPISGNTISCSTLDLTVTARDNNSTAIGAALMTLGNFDVKTAINPENAADAVDQGYVLHQRFTTPNDANLREVAILVAPTTPGAGTTQVELSGLELVRRDDE